MIVCLSFCGSARRSVAARPSAAAGIDVDCRFVRTGFRLSLMSTPPKREPSPLIKSLMQGRSRQAIREKYQRYLQEVWRRPDNCPICDSSYWNLADLVDAPLRQAPTIRSKWRNRDRPTCMSRSRASTADSRCSSIQASLTSVAQRKSRLSLRSMRPKASDEQSQRCHSSNASNPRNKRDRDRD